MSNDQAIVGVPYNLLKKSADKLSDLGQSHISEQLFQLLLAEPSTEKYDDTLLPFFAMMRKELHANVSKGDRPGWLSMSSDTCLLEIIYHFGKLQKAVKNRDGDGIIEYAADVANMSMMLVDICGLLGDDE